MFSFLSLLLEGFQVVIAAETSVVFFILAGLTLAGSAVGLTVTAPLFIIFSPILVPATIATAVLTTGFTAGGTLGAISVSFIRNKGEKRKNKQRPKGGQSTAKGSSADPSAQNLFEMPITGGYGGSIGGKSFSGTIGNKLTGGTTPPSGSNSGHGFGGFLTGLPLEKLFPGWFGGAPKTGDAPPPAAEKPPPPAAEKPPPPAAEKPPPPATGKPPPPAGKKPSPPAGKKTPPPAKKLY